MTNREKLANMALYDMLLMMNENSGKRCVLEQLGADPVERCSKEVFCRDCFARWLNTHFYQGNIGAGEWIVRKGLDTCRMFMKMGHKNCAFGRFLKDAEKYLLFFCQSPCIFLQKVVK